MSQLGRASRQNATLALPALPNGSTSKGNARPADRLHFVFKAEPRKSAAATAIASGRAMLALASVSDQDHQCKDDRTCRNQFAAQNAQIALRWRRRVQKLMSRSARHASRARCDEPMRQRPARSPWRSARPECARRGPRWSSRHQRRRQWRLVAGMIMTRASSRPKRCNSVNLAFTDRMVR